MNDLLNAVTDLAMFNGVVLIEQGGQVLFQRTYGYADYERRIDFDERTRFKIASASKAMTDAALATMLARREISVSDPLSRYFPSFPSADRITIEQITQHRSGIPHTNNQPWGDGSIVIPHSEIVERLAALPLDFEPGAQRSYSNGGYAVLARIMEMVRGQSYSELMQELVFDPLDMRDSGVITDSRVDIPRLAQGYQPGVPIGRRVAPRPYAVEMRPGGGSLYASARDLLRFFQAAWRNHLPGAESHPSLFGGTGAVRLSDGRSPGQYVDIRYERDADLIILSVANNYAAEFRWAENLAHIFLGRTPLFAALPALEIDLRIGADHPWIGRYVDERSEALTHVLRVSDQDQLLLSDEDGNPERALIPLRNGGFLDPLYYSVCRTDPGAAGRIVCARLYDGGFTYAFRR